MKKTTDWIASVQLMKVGLFFMIFFAQPLFAKVKLAGIFGDHMVLQRDQNVPIWGTAEPGEIVAVTAGKVNGKVTAGTDGKWMVRLSGLPVSTQSIEVTVQGKNTLVLHDVLVGDVWLCSGQSNMNLGFTADASSKEELPKSDHPLIRLFMVPKEPTMTLRTDLPPLVDGTTVGRWLVCSPQTIVQNGWGGFSAVAYYFGRDIQAFTGKPVGLIDACYGGTSVQAWTSAEAYQAVPTLKHYADENEKLRQDFAKNPNYYQEVVISEWKAGVEKWKVEHKAIWDAYQVTFQKWESENKKSMAEKGWGPPKPNEPGPKMPRDPSTSKDVPINLFNGMIAPIIPYGIKGAIWYQGENNAGGAPDYSILLPLMIKDWRTRWGVGDFPFLIVQLANFGENKPEAPVSQWALFRESQAKIAAEPNNGLAVTVDIGEPKDIHPRDKWDVGNRLSLVARKVAYGDSVVFSGPTYKSQSIDGNKIRLSFDNIGQGLTIGVPPLHFHPGLPRPDASSLRGFVIAGDDKKFVAATATIDGNSVVVSSEQVPNPKTVRYGWAESPDCNLYSKEGLPAVPFRSEVQIDLKK